MTMQELLYNGVGEHVVEWNKGDTLEDLFVFYDGYAGECFPTINRDLIDCATKAADKIEREVLKVRIDSRTNHVTIDVSIAFRDLRQNVDRYELRPNYDNMDGFVALWQGSDERVIYRSCYRAMGSF